ncbi:hypothetical protein L6R52_44365, partial [Myxococcota bacterium]|nr:hypothetical protein [Myxococcota bacterium]
MHRRRVVVLGPTLEPVLWDTVLWDTVLWDTVLWDTVLWDTVLWDRGDGAHRQQVGDERGELGERGAGCARRSGRRVLGGMLADRIIGYRRSIILGAILMGLGEFGLTFSGFGIIPQNHVTI